MARPGSIAFGSSGSSTQARYHSCARHFARKSVQFNVFSRRARFALLMCCVLACWVMPAMAQDSDSDVHITPREAKKSDPTMPADASGIADPSLRTHTKPIKKEVDLVLVPVTI